MNAWMNEGLNESANEMKSNENDMKWEKTKWNEMKMKMDMNWNEMNMEMKMDMKYFSNSGS